MLDLAQAPLDLCSRRLRLRRFAQTDLTPRYLGWLRDPEVTRYSNQRFVQHTLERCQSYFDSFSGSPHLFIAIDERESDTTIGTMTVYAAPPHQTADVGILLGERAVWGRGYGKEAWCTLIDWLLSTARVRKVTAGTLACNASMLRLLHASGMQHEATRRAQELVDGQPQDIVYYARFGHG
jgi:[ribosomal protein S5]-alanine N-acetyltransferase